MPRQSMWDTEHVDFLEHLMRTETPTAQESAVRMSKHFHRRVTAAHVNGLLQRMRTMSDPFYRNTPYVRSGSRFGGYSHQ